MESANAPPAGENPVKAPGENPAQAPGENPAKAPGENPVKAPGENPAKAPDEEQKPPAKSSQPTINVRSVSSDDIGFKELYTPQNSDEIEVE
jgi:hypothetical protein